MKAHSIIGMALDITERKLMAKKVQEELLESEKKAREAAETANRLRTNFLSELSHELRTPLNAIPSWNLLIFRVSIRKHRPRAANTVQPKRSQPAEIIEDLLDVLRESGRENSICR